ncbi:9168_t:CDS:10, partial [Entrophospora sp. SA101]
MQTIKVFHAFKFRFNSFRHSNRQFYTLNISYIVKYKDNNTLGNKFLNGGSSNSNNGDLTKCFSMSKFKIISRSKTVSKIKVASLPTKKLISPYIEKERAGPELDTTIGRSVRLAQKEYPNCIILTRVGQFWELYFEQAEQIAPILDIKLAKRKFSQTYMSFAGFPLQHLDRYLSVLVNGYGLHVAICEEYLNTNYEEDKLKFKRRVSRIITPGTLIDESFLPHDENNFLLSISTSLEGKTHYIGLSWIDITTGQFFLQHSTIENLSNNLARINPKEHASSSLLFYVRKNLFENIPHIQYPIKVDENSTMVIDESALHSLEIMITMKDKSKKGSLIDTIKRTKTMSGARKLDQYLSECISTSEINFRLDLVEYFYENTGLTEEIRKVLQECDDAIRISQRALQRVLSVEDFLKIKKTIEAINNLKDILERELKYKPDESLQNLLSQFQSQDELANAIDNAIDEIAFNNYKESSRNLEDNNILDNGLAVDENVDTNNNNIAQDEISNTKVNKRKVATTYTIEQELMLNTKEDNWFVKKDFSPKLRRLHKRLEAKYYEKIELQRTWKKELNITNLELKSHPTYGFLVSANYKIGQVDVEKKLNATRIHQFRTKKWFIQWSNLGAEIKYIKSQISEEEKKILQIICDKIQDKQKVIIKNIDIIDKLDIASSFAVLAREQKYVRPIINDSTVHKIIGGRHPVVELSKRVPGDHFVKNDCIVGEEQRLLLITGPNMGGKSTFLRQNAIISIMAQIGSFVPADHAEIGIVDKIFSRVGTSDNLYKGESTFMVEMKEASNILKHATSKSFVIMDEVGRGTTTLDGIAISYATLHHLYNENRCRTLFATHFHELPEMIKNFKNAACYCTDIKEEIDGSFLYNRKVKVGVNKNSAALHTAKLA